MTPPLRPERATQNRVVQCITTPPAAGGLGDAELDDWSQLGGNRCIAVDDVRRNPTLTEHAVHILPYRGLGTGIPRALQDWPDIELIDDVEANQFRVVIPRPNYGAATARVAPEVTDPVADPVDQMLSLLVAGPLPPSALMAGLGLKHRHTFRTNYLRPALLRQWIAMTLPDKPNSRLQRYRLTAAGQARLPADTAQKATP